MPKPKPKMPVNRQQAKRAMSKIAPARAQENIARASAAGQGAKEDAEGAKGINIRVEII